MPPHSEHASAPEEWYACMHGEITKRLDEIDRQLTQGRDIFAANERLLNEHKHLVAGLQSSYQRLHKMVEPIAVGTATELSIMGRVINLEKEVNGRLRAMETFTTELNATRADVRELNNSLTVLTEQMKGDQTEEDKRKTRLLDLVGKATPYIIFMLGLLLVKWQAGTQAEMERTIRSVMNESAHTMQQPQEPATNGQ